MGIAQIVEHEGYTRRPVHHDIALLVTANRIPFSRHIGLACLPTRRIPLDGEILKVMGWGFTSNFDGGSDVLKKVNLRVIPFRQCQQSWRNVREETMICTHEEGKDSCQGDSGGPLLWRDTRSGKFALVALVSFGGRCADVRPSVNTDVTAYIPWIQARINETKPETKTCSGY